VPKGKDPEEAGAPVEAPWSRTRIWTRLLLYPTHTLPTAAAPVLVAIGLAIRDGVFAPWPVALAFLGSWLIHIAGVFTDNHELLRKHADVAEHPELLDALEHGTLRLHTLRVVVAASLCASVLCGAYLVALGGMLALIIGVIGVIASVSYAGGPLAYARTGLAEPVFFLMFGVVAVLGAYYIQLAAVQGAPAGMLAALRALPPRVLFAGLPVGALVTGVLIIDDIRDAGFDTVKGWRTGVVRFGIRAARIRFVVLYCAAYLALFALCRLPGYGWPVLLPLLTLPLALNVTRAVCTRRDTAGLLAMTPRASMLALAYSALLGIGLATG
jgi:1,4-dihydroxy-2-naphthoate polyprenyltransferase